MDDTYPECIYLWYDDDNSCFMVAEDPLEHAEMEKIQVLGKYKLVKLVVVVNESVMRES